MTENEKKNQAVKVIWWEVLIYLGIFLILGYAWGYSVGTKNGEEEAFEQGYNTGWMEADDRTIPTLEAVGDQIRAKENALERIAVLDRNLNELAADNTSLSQQLADQTYTSVVTATPVFHPMLLTFDGYVLEGALATSFTDGVWIVGEDIEPGTYRNRDAILSSEEDIWRTTKCKWVIYRGIGTVGWRTGTETADSGELFNQVRLYYNRTFQSQYCGVWERIRD